MSVQSSSPQHEEGFQSESPNLNIGGLQGGYTEESGGHTEESQEGQAPQDNYRRSGLPAKQQASFYEDDSDEVDDIDESMERDTKSTIPHENDDIDNDIHERVHKDVIPRPEDFY